MPLKDMSKNYGDRAVKGQEFLFRKKFYYFRGGSNEKTKTPQPRELRGCVNMHSSYESRRTLCYPPPPGTEAFTGNGRKLATVEIPASVLNET